MTREGTVTEQRWIRLSGPAAGIVFVVLLGVGTALAQGAPTPDKSAGTTLTWYASHRGTVLAFGLLSGLAAMVFLWFLAHVRHTVSGHPAGGRVADTLAISGTAMATTAMVSTLSPVALAILANRPGVTPDPRLVRMLADLNSLFFGTIGLFFVVFVLAFALTFFAGALGPRWVGWIALVAGILGLVSSSAARFPDTNGKPSGLTFLGFIALIGLLLSILIASITMLRTETATT
jgi:hypothetical protein